VLLAFATSSSPTLARSSSTKEQPLSQSSPSLTAAVYAKDAPRLAAFYAEVLRLVRVEEGASFVLLASSGIELAIVQAPPAIAEAIVVAEPPVVLEDTPVKLSFRVDDVEAVRPVVARLGGGLGVPDAAWSWRGQLHLDGWDPEGNVFQLRQPQGT
jgi:predicted enzyme related to lactoylglutathione lyase